MSEKPSIHRYIPALLAAAVALIGAVYTLWGFEGEEADWTSLEQNLSDLSEAASLAEQVAVADEDFAGCVASKSANALVSSVSESVSSASDGVCTIPAVDVDVSQCIAWKDTTPEGVDVPSTVQLAVSPVLLLAKGALNHASDESLKNWGSAVVDWLSSGQESVVALIEQPEGGTLSFESVTVENCKP